MAGEYGMGSPVPTLPTTRAFEKLKLSQAGKNLNTLVSLDSGGREKSCLTLK
jgi:hypothetical protein